MLWWHSLITTLGVALGGEAYNQILLIVPLTIALIYMQWRMLPRSFESSAVAGSLLLAGALATAGFARWGAPGLADDLRLSRSMISLVPCSIRSLALFSVRSALL